MALFGGADVLRCDAQGRADLLWRRCQRLNATDTHMIPAWPARADLSLGVGCGDFSSYYRTTLPELIKIDPQNALSSFQSLLNAVRQAGYPLYLFIEEYDNFASCQVPPDYRPVY